MKSPSWTLRLQPHVRTAASREVTSGLCIDIDYHHCLRENGRCLPLKKAEAVTPDSTVSSETSETITDTGRVQTEEYYVKQTSHNVFIEAGILTLSDPLGSTRIRE